MLIGSRCHLSSQSDLLPLNPFAHVPQASVGRLTLADFYCRSGLGERCSTTGAPEPDSLLRERVFR